MQLSFPIYRLKRQAKLLSRERGIPLHLALDQIALEEGFHSWSHLSKAVSQDMSTRAMLDACGPGEVILLAGRPGHGKTRLALDLLSAAVAADRRGYFFTLEYHEADLPQSARGVHVDTSDEICADHIMTVMADAPTGSLAAIDYLQLLDQRRTHPALSEQVAALAQFARSRAVTVLALSQIDRRFELRPTGMPGFEDIRLPNPLDFSLISKGCFLHKGTAHFATP